jgi:predicted ribosome quality control (RQC) complex YloA/Tae2 family protein
MAQLEQAQEKQLEALKEELEELQKRLQAVHKKTGYEDLSHGVLALQIAEHAIEETLEHTGLGGEIQHKKNIKAHRQAMQWYKIVKGLRVQGGKFLKTHPSEDLETALKALEIAEGSLEEVAERYE